MGLFLHGGSRTSARQGTRGDHDLACSLLFLSPRSLVPYPCLSMISFDSPTQTYSPMDESGVFDSGRLSLPETPRIPPIVLQRSPTERFHEAMAEGRLEVSWVPGL